MPGSDLTSSVRCFVIGPIGNELAPVGSDPRIRWEEAQEVYEKVIQAACEPLGLRPMRADEIKEPGEIPEQAFVRLRDWELVIADVTDANPNVMYELGLRHSTDKATIQIGVYGKLPFDVSTIRTIQFSRTPAGLVDGRKKLEAALDSALSGGGSLVTAARIFAGPRPADETARGAIVKDEVGVEAEEEPGFLEVLADMESAMPEMSQSLTHMTGVIERLGGLSERGTQDMEANDRQGGGASGRLLVALRFAEALNDPADALERIAANYEDQLGRVNRGMNYLIEQVEQDPDKAQELGELPQSLRTMADAAQEGLEKGVVLADTILGLASAARPLRAPTRRIHDALKRVAASGTVIRGWSDRMDRALAS